MTRVSIRACVLFTALAAGPIGGTLAAAEQAGGARAQERPTVERQILVLPAEVKDSRAEEVRGQLQTLLDRYPPSLGRVLKLDPTLMANSAYLTPYPALAAFFERHPEVSRNPSYFLEFVRSSNSPAQPVDAATETKRQALDNWKDMMTGSLVLTGLMSFLFALAAIVRYVINHRRWLRTTKVQTDAHTKLMERFTSSEELMAYAQSPAGRRFLEAIPLSIDSAGPALAAPLSRILWSVQAGLVLVCVGTGMFVVRRYVLEEVGDMLLTIGIFGLSMGAGFILAATASYLLSQRLGLLDNARRPTRSAE